MWFGFSTPKLVGAARARPGRAEPLFQVPAVHFVNGNRLVAPLPDGLAHATFAMGCFWGAERKFWKEPGVYSTFVGYAGGHTRNLTYQEVCAGDTDHTEVVGVVYDAAKVSYARLLQLFWESHDPKQGMRQGNDVGTQYRSAIYTHDADQAAAAATSRAVFQAALTASGYGEITTEFAPAREFWYAEADHQQYLAKNPNGYCGIGGTGVSCPVGHESKRTA